MTTDAIRNKAANPGDPAEQTGGEERRAFLACLASAAFFMGAIALVNPALADECGDVAELARSAARKDALPRDRMHTLVRALDKALDHHARGDDSAFRVEITVLRQALGTG